MSASPFFHRSLDTLGDSMRSSHEVDISLTLAEPYVSLLPVLQAIKGWQGVGGSLHTCCLVSAACWAVAAVLDNMALETQVTYADLDIHRISGAMTNLIFKCHNKRATEVCVPLSRLSSLYAGKPWVVTINNPLFSSCAACNSNRSSFWACRRAVLRCRRACHIYASIKFGHWTTVIVGV